MDSVEKRLSEEPRDPFSKGERFKRILKHIEQDAPAHSASEAHAMVENAFAAIEYPLAARPNIGDPMQVNPFFNMSTTEYKGKTLWYEFYENDLLLLGENGAIEIRSTRNRITPQTADERPFAELPLVLEKAGADGRGIWAAEGPTS